MDRVTAPTRVIVADDDVLLREGVASLLERSGFDVVGQAGDGAELLALSRELVPELVLVDIRMPPDHATEGLDAAKAIRAELPGVGILVLSAHVEVEQPGRPAAGRPAAGRGSTRLGRGGDAARGLETDACHTGPGTPLARRGNEQRAAGVTTRPTDTKSARWRPRNAPRPPAMQRSPSRSTGKKASPNRPAASAVTAPSASDSPTRATNASPSGWRADATKKACGGSVPVLDPPSTRPG
jgi:CheY-like chemotaxis protein